MKRYPHYEAIATHRFAVGALKWVLALLTTGMAAKAQNTLGLAAQASTNSPADPPTPAGRGTGLLAQQPAQNQEQDWNFHAQNTVIMQGDPGFPAKYSGPNSLHSGGEVDETVTLELFGGVRLWPGAEAHADFLMWQGYGLSKTYGIEDFPNGDAYKAGTETPNANFSRLFIRQTIGLGGEQEDIQDSQLTLAGKQDISRITLTVGRFSPLDVIDNNAYAANPHTQFMNWAFMANPTFDYGQDTVGYTTGMAAELNEKNWALRYVFFQMPRDKNGFTGDDQYLMWPNRGDYGPFLKSWSMATEFERRYSIDEHPGAIRLQAWLDEADFASYTAATSILLAQGPGADISPARAYRYKYGFGLNWEQEIAKDLGVFSRLGWTDGHNETWTFTDIDYSASFGVSIKGDRWNRADDTLGLAFVLSGASLDNQRFLEAGGTDMLDGDGALTYGWEKVLETYYDFKIWKTIHGALDYQFVDNPAFNRDRGPVSIFGARLHWEF